MAIDKIKLNSLGTTGTASSSNFLRGDMAWTAIAGDIESVVAGAGMTGGGTSGDVTLNVIAGTGITVYADDVQVTLASPITSATSLVTVGTIGTGTWQGTAVANAYIGSTIDATKLADGTVTNAEFQYINSLSSNAQTQLTAKAALATAQTFTAGQRGEITALTSAASVTIDMADSNNFSCTMAHNIVFENPSNDTAGQSGSIFLTQDGTGSRTASWGTDWEFAAGTAPTLTTTAAASDRIDYVIKSGTSIQAVATLALA